MPGKDTVVLVSWEDCGLKLVGADKRNLQGSRGKNIRIFPNPSNGTVNISITPVEEDINMEIIDIAGKTYRMQTINKGQDMVSADVSKLNPDVYILKFNLKNSIVYRKLILNPF